MHRIINMKTQRDFIFHLNVDERDTSEWGGTERRRVFSLPLQFVFGLQNFISSEWWDEGEKKKKNVI